MLHVLQWWLRSGLKLLHFLHHRFHSPELGIKLGGGSPGSLKIAIKYDTHTIVTATSNHTCSEYERLRLKTK